MIEENNLQEEKLAGEGEMIDDSAMKADLKADFEKLDRKKHSLDSKKIMAKNKDKDHLMESMRKVFNKMQEQGVDLNSQDSIREFLLELEKKDPDLVILFEQAISSLAPEDAMSFGPMQGAALPQEDLSGANLPGVEQVTENLEENIPIPGDIPPVAPSPNIETTGPEGINKFDGIRKQILRQ